MGNNLQGVPRCRPLFCINRPAVLACFIDGDFRDDTRGLPKCRCHKGRVYLTRGWKCGSCGMPIISLVAYRFTGTASVTEFCIFLDKISSSFSSCDGIFVIMLFPLLFVTFACLLCQNGLINARPSTASNVDGRHDSVTLKDMKAGSIESRSVFLMLLSGPPSRTLSILTSSGAALSNLASHQCSHD